jgi:hypothetical protein
MRVVEQVGFFTGLGVVIVMVAAAAAGRITAVPSLSTVETVPVAEVPASREPLDETVVDEGETRVIR